MRSSRARTDVAGTRRRRSPRTPTDEELIAAVERGDQRAFAEIYASYAARLYGLIRRIVVDPDHAEEVLQEVFLQVWHQAGRCDPERGSVETWLTTVAHRRAVDRVRHEQRLRDRETRRAAWRSAAPVDATADPVTGNLERERVRQAVRKGLEVLTNLQHESIGLAYYGGLTYREVSAHLDVPLGTVKSRIRDGLIRLREELEEHARPSVPSRLARRHS